MWYLMACAGRVVWGCSCASSPTLFTITSVKTEDADMMVLHCCVVPVGCTCQIALRADLFQPLPGTKHQFSLGFLHIHATLRCWMDSLFYVKGVCYCVCCSESWQPCRSLAPVESVVNAPDKGLCCWLDATGRLGGLLASWYESEAAYVSYCPAYGFACSQTYQSFLYPCFPSHSSCSCVCLHYRLQCGSSGYGCDACFLMPLECSSLNFSLTGSRGFCFRWHGRGH